MFAESLWNSKVVDVFLTIPWYLNPLSQSNWVISQFWGAKFKGIFVGEKIKVQVKLYAAYLKLEGESSGGYKSLFRFNTPQLSEPKIILNEDEPAGGAEEQEEETFSVPVKEVKEDEPVEVKEPPKKPAVVVRKPAKKVTKA